MCARCELDLPSRVKRSHVASCFFGSANALPAGKACRVFGQAAQALGSATARGNWRTRLTLFGQPPNPSKICTVSDWSKKLSHPRLPFNYNYLDPNFFFTYFSFPSSTLTHSSSLPPNFFKFNEHLPSTLRDEVIETHASLLPRSFQIDVFRPLVFPLKIVSFRFFQRKSKFFGFFLLLI